MSPIVKLTPFADNHSWSRPAHHIGLPINDFEHHRRSLGTRRPLFWTEQSPVKKSEKGGEGYLCRSGMRMRFHPKRRASTDQAPGPSSARAAPRVPSMIQLHGSPGCEKACHHAMTATNTPAMGVQKPASRSIPTHVVTAGSIADPNGGPPSSLVTPCTISPIPAP